MESTDVLFTQPTLVICLITVLLENTKDPWFGVLLSMQTSGWTHSWSVFFTSAHTLHNLVEGCYVWLTQHKLAEKETFTPHTHNKEPWFLLVHFIPYMLITRLCFIVSRDYSWDKLQLFPNCYYDDWIFVLCQALFTHYTPKFDPSMMHYWFHAGNHTAADVKN